MADERTYLEGIPPIRGDVYHPRRRKKLLPHHVKKRRHNIIARHRLKIRKLGKPA